jgi:hypothetical protein
MIVLGDAQLDSAIKQHTNNAVKRYTFGIFIFQKARSAQRRISQTEKMAA